MNLEVELSKSIGKQKVDELLRAISAKPDNIPHVVQFLNHEELKIRHNAAWVIGYIAEQETRQLQPFTGLLLKQLIQNKPDDTVKRGVLRALQYLTFTGDQKSELINICFEYLCNRSSADAVRALSLGLLAAQAKEYPELNNELKIIIEDELEADASPSFRSRAKKVLKQFK